jgi:hypothetical protein
MFNEPTKRCPRCRTENPAKQVICKGFGCCYVFMSSLVAQSGDEGHVAPIGRTWPVGTAPPGKAGDR